MKLCAFLVGFGVGLLYFATLVFFLQSAGCAGSPEPFVYPDSGADSAPFDAGSPESSVDAPAYPRPYDGGSLDLNNVSTTPLTYRGGRVLSDPVSLYEVWYGAWEKAEPRRVLVDGFASSLSGTPWIRIVSGLTAPLPDGGTQAPASTWTVAASIEVGTPKGTSLYDAQLRALVSELVASGLLPFDANGVYAVFTSPEVAVSSFGETFCGAFCGYHDSFVPDLDGGASGTLKYLFVGDPTNCLNNCSIQPTAAGYGFPDPPNGDWGADSMASVLAHELSEVFTDPDPVIAPAWRDAYDEEVADKCAWRFDPAFEASPTSLANVSFGGRSWLVQENWLNDPQISIGGGCVLFPLAWSAR